jgi:formylmethanofuran dehydrogenase subunit C
MSGWVTLTPRDTLPVGLELDGFDPAACAERSHLDIASTPLWCGVRTRALGDLFRIDGEYSDQVRIAGPLGGVDGVGASMSGGALVVEGHVGNRAGAGMTGGRLIIEGDVGDDAAIGMRGGFVQVTGTAGDRLAAGFPGASKGMSGGEVLVGGAAGSDVAARLRRGLVVVGDRVGPVAARDMIAGTLVVCGATGVGAGARNKRGSIIALGGGVVPPTYRYACTYEPPFVRLLLIYLQRQRGLVIPRAWIDGRYRRYCGDAGRPGRGEFLELVP